MQQPQWREAAYQPHAEGDKGGTETIRTLRPLQTIHATHVPTEFINYMRSAHPTEDASTFAAASMKLVSKMERTLHQHLLNGFNTLGAPTDNMRGLYQGPQTMRNCQLCEKEVTQRWEVQANISATKARETNTIPQHRSQRYHTTQTSRQNLY